MCGLARLLCHSRGSQDALVGIYTLTSLGHNGLYLVSLMSKDENGDLDNVLVRLSAMAVAPQADVAVVARSALEELQNFLHGAMLEEAPWEAKRPSMKPGMTWPM
jgi:hypothetical protein